VLRYVIGRVAQAVLVLWAAYTISFLVLYELPGDPVTLLLGGASGDVSAASPAQIAAVKRQYGLDKPVIVQYFDQLWRALHLNFGDSISQAGRPVSSILRENVPPTLALAGFALLLALIGGLVLAFLATYVEVRWVRIILRRMPALGVSFPSFWIGILLIQLFSFSWPLFPSTGNQGFASLVLPAVTMAIPAAAILAQVLTRSMTDTLAEPYIATARARGQRRILVHLRHVLPNAFLPTLTIFGLLVGYTVTGAVIAETVFSRAGLGSATAQAVLAQDVPTVQAVVVFAAAAFVTVNLIVDLLYPVFDPRVARRPRRL
jgi:peptide/nickel transport system permease protein